MLDTLRRGASGWVAKILMGLLVVSFAVWGIADIFHGYSSDVVATVGKEQITLDQYQRALHNETQKFSQRLGQPLTPQQVHQFGIDASALSQLIGLAALDGGTRAIGLSISDETVAHNIMTDPQLIGAFGKFDRQNFDQTLQQMGLSEAMFVADRRKFLLRKQINDVLQAGVKLPATMLGAISTYQNETRIASYLVLPPDAVGTIGEPDEKTLEAYYQKAAIHFTTPETRDFSVMTLEPKDLAATVSISEADLKKAYEQRRGEFDVPEKRKVEQIPFATVEAAKNAEAKLKGGEPIEKMVSSLGLEQKDVELGLVSRSEMISPSVADAAFALKSGEYSDPVQGPLGPVILHVTQIVPAQPSSYEQVKDKLRVSLAADMASSEVYDVQNSIEDARAGGASLEEAAAKDNLKVVKFTGVTAKGLTIDGKKPAGLPDYKDLVDTVFKSEQGDQIPPGDTGSGGYYWLRVDGVTAAQQKPLKDVRADVVALWKTEKRKADLAELAQSVVARGNKGEAFEKIASSIGRTVLVSPAIGRSSENDTFSRNAVARLFAAPRGGFTYGPVGFGNSLVIMQVKEINDPKPNVESDDYKKLDTDMTDAVQTDLLMTYITGLEKKLGTEVNTHLLERSASAEDTQ